MIDDLLEELRDKQAVAHKRRFKRHQNDYDRAWLERWHEREGWIYDKLRELGWVSPTETPGIGSDGLPHEPYPDGD